MVRTPNPDEDEARRLLADEIADLRRLPYAELRARMPRVLARWRLLGVDVVKEARDENDHRVREVVGPSGASYTLETSIFWDDEEAATIRVVVSIDGGPIPPTRPRSSDFIIAPDGTFVGE